MYGVLDLLPSLNGTCVLMGLQVRFLGEVCGGVGVALHGQVV